MALTKCKECGAEVSTNAAACPKCGAKQPKKSGCLKFIGIAFLALIVLSVIGQMAGRDSTHSGSSTNSATTSPAANSKSAPAPAPPPIPGSQWLYSSNDDPMAKGKSYFAMVLSTNTVSFKFPYNGDQRGRLTIRTHPRHGKDVILVIDKGQFLCRSYEDCDVLVRFDDGTAQKFAGVGPSDNSSTSVFIRNYDRFLTAMKKANTVRISTEVHQEGSPVFEFDVSGFDENKYLEKGK